jgi:hypothetical protein
LVALESPRTIEVLQAVLSGSTEDLEPVPAKAMRLLREDMKFHRNTVRS